MKIETKFDLGQQVCRKEDGQRMVIIQIIFEVCNDDFVIPVQYLCMFNDTCYKYLENELTAEMPKPKSVFELKKGNEYCCIDECGDWEINVFRSDDYDEKCIAQGNAFLTVNEAEKEAKRREIHQRLKKLANGYEFKLWEKNHFILFNAKTNTVLTEWLATKYEPFKIYFKSEQDALNAIEEIGEDVLIRDYFGYELQA